MTLFRPRGKYLGHSLLALAAVSAGLYLPSATAQETLTSNSTGMQGGHYYSFWKDSGNASMTLYDGGRYGSQWDNGTNNWVGGKGWNPGGSKVVSYEGYYGVDNSQNSYVALYGWTKNPLVEYYVIESYGSYNPSSCNGGQNYGSFQSDGATYNVRRCQRVNQPSIEGNTTFYQYFSVRNPKKGFGEISGTINTGNHFNYWRSQGLNLGSHDYMILATEGYQSRGSSDLSVREGPGTGTTSSANANSSTSTSGPSSTDIIVRAQGVVGDEHINLLIAGEVVASWSLSTSMDDYVYTGKAAGDIQVEFDNDSGDRDVILDYVFANGETRQAEDMEYNTSTYDGECGGGSYSEEMHCDGVIGFGDTSDCFSGDCSGTPPSSSSSSSSVISSSTTPTSSSSSSNAISSSGAVGNNCAGVNVYPNWTARDWSGGAYNHAAAGDRMVYQNNLYQANWYTKTVPGSDGSWSSLGACGQSTNSSSSSSKQSSSSLPMISSSSSSSSSSFSSSGQTALVVAINAGGGSATYNGIQYSADAYYSGGDTSSTTDNIGGTTEDSVFQSERYGSYSYNIPVTQGTYSIDMQFAEIYHTSAGARAFNVLVEGQQVLSSVDLYTLAGSDGAYTYVVDGVQVNDGSLDITLQTITDNGTIGGFAIFSPDGSLDTTSSSSSSSSGSGGLGSAGCGSSPRISNGRHTINVGGLNREYIIDIPSNYNPNNPYKLVFAWHWRDGRASNVANDGYYGFKNLANNTAIFVAPDRYSASDNGWPNTNGRDLDFARAMLNEFKNEFCIDEDRVFSAGWSYGGMMSFAVGREMGDSIRAIAPASGALFTSFNDSGLPVAAFITHGNNDNVVGINLGKEARDLYVSANNCSNNTVPTQPSGCVEYQGCDSANPVVWCEFSGGHQTPSFYSQGAWNFFNSF